ncbi:MAG: DUF6785 family protein [Thermodesulforhabdaceae bacterium]
MFVELSKIRWLTILGGTVVVLMLAWITPWSNIVRYNSPLGGSHFPTAPFGILLMLAIFWNGLLGRFIPRARLSALELLYIWLVSVLATTIAYTGFARTFFLNLLWHPEAMQNIVWKNLLPDGEHLARSVLQGVGGGGEIKIMSLLKIIPWGEWCPFLALWVIFLALVVITLLGISGVFAHQWIENERMALPLIQIPKIFSEESYNSSLLRSLKNTFFIVGLCVPVLIHTMNGLATYFPSIPQIPALLLAQPYIPQEGLLRGFSKLKIYIYPAFVGFAYMAPRQISLSIWFFFLMGLLVPGLLSLFGMSIPNITLGTTFGPGVARAEEMQMVGAYGICGIFIIWLSRRHIWNLLFDRTYLGKKSEYVGLVHPRLGLGMAITGYILTAFWLVAFGMETKVVLPFLLVCLMLQIVVAKMICQGGLPYFTLPVAPSDGFLAFFPSKLFSSMSIYLGVVVQKMAFLDVRESLLPTLIHASALIRKQQQHRHSGIVATVEDIKTLQKDEFYKLTGVVESRRKFLLGIIVSIILSFTVSALSMLVIYYKYGALSLPDSWALETVFGAHEKALNLIQHPEAPKPWIAFYVVLGALIMTVLIGGYHRFPWWPFHPMGYLMTYNSATHVLWFSFFLGWLLNWLVFRYGGVKAYVAFRWFFVGLVVGDVVMAILWIIVGWWAPVAYHVFPT